MARGLADPAQESPGSTAGCALDQTGQVSLGTFLSDPGGGPQENQFIWEDSDGDRMLLESQVTEDMTSCEIQKAI